MVASAETQSQILFGETLNWRSPLGPSPWISVKTMEEGEERLQVSERIEDTMRIWPTESTKQSSQRLKQQAQCMYGSAPDLCLYVTVIILVFL